MASEIKNPIYYAVIFSSQLADNSEGYEEMSARMISLVQEQPGFLGYESARGDSGFGITVSYWESLQAIAAWKANVEHQKAQKYGRELAYLSYSIKIVKMENEYSYETQSFV